MKRRNGRFVLASVLICVSVAGALSADEPSSWSQWRGPNRNGIIPEKDWPDSLSKEHLKERWFVSLGPSYSGPIVSADRVFVTETKDRKTEVVRGLERESGKELWSTEWQGSMSVPFFAKSNGDWIRATPAYDGERIYVAGMRDVLVCVDVASGEQLWRVDFVEKLGTPLPAFGFASSPLVLGDHVYVQAAASVVKLDKRTGEILWQSLKDSGGMAGSAFSSPYVATLNGKEQLLVQTRRQLAGVDLEDGQVLWSRDIPAFRGMNILTPTVVKNKVFTSSYGGKTILLESSKGE